MSSERESAALSIRLGKAAGLLEQLQSKCSKQTHEIARLTREVEQLRADKRNLNFDLNKLSKENKQLRA